MLSSKKNVSFLSNNYCKLIRFCAKHMKHKNNNLLLKNFQYHAFRSDLYNFFKTLSKKTTISAVKKAKIKPLLNLPFLWKSKKCWSSPKGTKMLKIVKTPHIRVPK